MNAWRMIILLAGWAGMALAQYPPLAPTNRAIPGDEPTPWLLYQHPQASNVMVAGSWDAWSGRYAFAQADGVWRLDTRTLPARFGRHEYKFIANDVWEKGDNRFFYINANRELERPPAIFIDAVVDDFDLITVNLRQAIAADAPLQVRLEPDCPVRKWELSSPLEDASQLGYMVSGGSVTFLFDQKAYGLTLPAETQVAVAGNFNGWDGRGGGGRWLLKPGRTPGVWEGAVQLQGIRPAPGEPHPLFKFVLNGDRWLPPPARAPNAIKDAKGNRNLRLDPAAAGGWTLRVYTDQPLDLAATYAVIIDGLAERPLWVMATPGAIFEKLLSSKPLGAILDRAQNATTYRLFAPRAKQVWLGIYNRPEYVTWVPTFTRHPPAERYPLWRDSEDGVWEITLLGLDIGKYYAFVVEGPSGDGEAFDAHSPFGDPYARAAARAENCTLVMDPDATNEWFSGWTDQDYVQVEPKDTIIYEMHVRGQTIHPSAGVPGPLRGKFAGLLETLGTGTGLDHLKALGVTTLELLPPVEFSGGDNNYDWGYAPVYYFAPESSYGRVPFKGSQYYEFKHLVNQLHRQGFGVVIDVVFNHVGGPNIFNLIDKKYYFRLNADFTFSNHSACGNDFKTESPMARRLIVDNILYWMKEFHVDGFRFDLAELIDMQTMREIRDAARAVNPKVLLISEPWSPGRGENKHQLKGTGWSAWNNDFRYACKDFVMGMHNREWLRNDIIGSINTWALNPLQPINYLESHDDMALADELCTGPNHDGRLLLENDVAANRLAATILFTSLGIPMIYEGQEFLRSKRGFNNTYDKGDDVNAIRWDDRERPLAAETLDYYTALIQLRRSPDGAAFRVAQRPPNQYYRWLMPPNSKLMGYLVNSPRIHEGASFMILLNADSGDQAFTANFPKGNWRLIGNGQMINPGGLPDVPPIQGPQTLEVRVPGISAYIFKDGFAP